MPCLLQALHDSEQQVHAAKLRKVPVAVCSSFLSCKAQGATRRCKLALGYAADRAILEPYMAHLFQVLISSSGHVMYGKATVNSALPSAVFSLDVPSLLP